MKVTVVGDDLGQGCIKYGQTLHLRGMWNDGEAGWLKVSGGGVAAGDIGSNGAAFEWKVRRPMYYTSLTACPGSDGIPTKAECGKAHKLLGLDLDRNGIKVENKASIGGGCSVGSWNSFSGTGPAGTIDPKAVCKDYRQQSTRAFEQLLEKQKEVQLVLIKHMGAASAWTAPNQ